MRKQIHPYLGLGLGVMAVSSAAIFIKLASAPPLVIATYRMLLASLILMPWAWYKYKRQLFSLSKREVYLIICSGTLLAIHFAAWISSLLYTSVASSTVLVSTQPIFAMLLARIFYHEQVTRRQLFAVALTLVGSGIIGFADVAQSLAPNPLLGDLLALIGAIAAAGYFLCGKALRQRLDVIPYAATAYSVSAIVLLVLTLGTQTPLFPYSVRDWLLFAALALICTVIGHSSLNWALAYLPTTAVGIAILGEPIGASLMALFIWREIPSPAQLAGSAVLLAGILLYMLPSKNKALT